MKRFVVKRKIQIPFSSCNLLVLFLFCFLNAGAQTGTESTLPDFRVERYENGRIRFVLAEVNEALHLSQDSIEAFKAHAIDFAKQGEPEIASEYILKYISATTDLSILNDHLFQNIKDSTAYQKIKQQYTPKVSFLSILYLYAGLLGFYIFVLLNLKKGVDRIGNLLISLFILFHSLFILHLSLYVINYQYHLPHTLFISTTFSFLYGPLLYFYFKRINFNYKFKVWDALHLVPSIMLLIYIMPYYLMSANEKFNVIFDKEGFLLPGAYTIIIVKIISLAVYAFLIFKMYRQNVNNQKAVEHREEEKNKILWQRNMMSINVMYLFSYIVYAGIITRVITIPWLIHLQIMVMVLVVFYVAYISHEQPEIFKGIVKLMDPTDLFKYKKSGLTPSFSHDLREKLVYLLEEEKIYRLNSINLDMLAEKMDTTRHNASQVINEHFGLNFFELINHYRITEASEILKNQTDKKMSIIEVAYEVGFNNKVTFNKSFKKFHSVTPSQYIGSLQS
ncbi:AraC family transcriptional regulator [Ulvibacter sp. MAR_2010_11]|uniref:helix-turn-helix domain-containing protein n=1 Tax=Ulvibacter sp. MAR_2010_11 TaxID=1250229 RepID=UPI000C2BB98D|nr:helix-turn-helix domain-containing protein [Ulvibacter sp. MAR_2010_11]PKA82176.1 AraC family transcriptional regulator [Ulvibacter sp. MAR_2010_11]